MTSTGRSWTGSIGWFLVPLALCPVVALVRPGDRHGAVARAEWLFTQQRSLGVAIEPSIHSWFVARPVLAGAATIFYLGAHLSMVIATACWLAARHPEAFVRFRRTFALAQVLTVAAYLALPVAPLRMLLGGGDGPAGASWTRSMQYELAAMPSGHVVFALVVAIAVWRNADGGWRWIAVVHPACTLVTVVATANHLLVDALGAGVVVAAAALALRLVEAIRPTDGAVVVARAVNARSVA